MWRSIFVIVLFVICTVFEIVEIVSFEKNQKKDKDEEFIKLYRKCHWTYMLLFAAGAADRIIALLEKLG